MKTLRIYKAIFLFMARPKNELYGLRSISDDLGFVFHVGRFSFFGSVLGEQAHQHYLKQRGNK